MKPYDLVAIHRFNKAWPLAAAICFLLHTQTGWGQSWPVNNPEVRESVPQYVPRYPLTTTELEANNAVVNRPLRTDPGTPSASAKQPLKFASPLTTVTPPNPSRPVVPNDPAVSFDPSNPNFSSDRQSGVAGHPVWDAAETEPPNPTTATSLLHAGLPGATALPANSFQTDSTENVEVDLNSNRSPFPVDPRNPCNVCTRPVATQPLFACDLPGLKGRPYIEKLPGGCLCDKRKPNKHPEFSVYWPRPFSAKLDEHFPQQATKRHEPCQEKRIVDLFDPLANVKLSGYQRKDNGYCGRGADPYGCLGESKYSGRVVETGPTFR